MTVFRKNCHSTSAKCKLPKDACVRRWLRDLTGVAREVRTVNDGFRRSRLDDGSLKIIEDGGNMTHMADLGLKLGQTEFQRGSEFNGHPPDPLKPAR